MASSDAENNNKGGDDDDAASDADSQTNKVLTPKKKKTKSARKKNAASDFNPASVGVFLLNGEKPTTTEEKKNQEAKETGGDDDNDDASVSSMQMKASNKTKKPASSTSISTTTSKDGKDGKEVKKRKKKKKTKDDGDEKKPSKSTKKKPTSSSSTTGTATKSKSKEISLAEHLQVEASPTKRRKSGSRSVTESSSRRQKNSKSTRSSSSSPARPRERSSTGNLTDPHKKKRRAKKADVISSSSPKPRKERLTSPSSSPKQHKQTPTKSPKKKENNKTIMPIIPAIHDDTATTSSNIISTTNSSDKDEKVGAKTGTAIITPSSSSSSSSDEGPTAADGVKSLASQNQHDEFPESNNNDSQDDVLTQSLLGLRRLIDDADVDDRDDDDGAVDSTSLPSSPKKSDINNSGASGIDDEDDLVSSMHMKVTNKTPSSSPKKAKSKASKTNNEKENLFHQGRMEDNAGSIVEETGVSEETRTAPTAGVNNNINVDSNGDKTASGSNDTREAGTTNDTPISSSNDEGNATREEETKETSRTTSGKGLPSSVPFLDATDVVDRGDNDDEVEEGNGVDHRLEPIIGKTGNNLTKDISSRPDKGNMESGHMQSSGANMQSPGAESLKSPIPSHGRNQTAGTPNQHSPLSSSLTQPVTPPPSSKGMGPKTPSKADWIAQKQAVVMAALATPRRGKKPTQLETPKATPRRTLNALNIATPRAKNRSFTPPPRRGRKAFAEKDADSMLEGYIKSAISLLNDQPKYKDDVRDAIYTIHMAKGFPRSRRLSMRDNELICNLIGAIRNDPSVTKIEVDCDSVFGAVETTLLFNFIDSLRLNFHLKTLQFRGVVLGNDFLYALASSLESNFALKRIDLSANCFTSEGLVEFCKALGNLNETCTEVFLEDQTTPISVAGQDDVLDAFRQNRTLTRVRLDFQTGEEGSSQLEEILKQNRHRNKREIDLDQKIVDVFRDMAELARELDEQKKADEEVLQVPDDDWDYLHELAVLFDKHKLKKEIQTEPIDEISGNQKTIKENENLTGKKKSEFLFGKFRDILEESVSCFNSDGSFLTDEFISKFLVEDEDTTAIVFDFHGQWKLFKRFPPQDPHRRLIVTKFVDAIVCHSRASEFTGISMANTGCGNDFLITLSERLVEDETLLPNLQMLNFETNYINETGVIALSKLISHPTAAKYLQVVRLENQKGLLKSKAEVALMKALRVNRSIVVLGLRLRNLLEKQQVFKYLVRNIDFIRQARQRHAKATGKQRARNEVELIFDRVAENDPAIDKVDMSVHKRFLTLTREEKCKAASSFTSNKFVTVVNFNSCDIDDEFAIELGKAIRTNSTIEKLFLENNAISGEGVKALFQGLGENKSIEEIRLHHQSRMIVSADEELLPDIIESNSTIMKIGIDLRNKVAQVKLDRKLKHNVNNFFKECAEANLGEFHAEESYLFLK